MFTIMYPLALALLLPTGLACPIEARSTDLTKETLLAIAPTSKSCAGAEHPLECRTAGEAVNPIVASFDTYKITDPATKAAVISTIVLESGEFKYAHHYFPSYVDGQGTRNMQSAKFNLEYAKSIPNLVRTEEYKAAEAAGPENVTSLLIYYSNYDFGSAAWFLTSQCEPDVVSGLAKAGTKSFNAYLDCIGTKADAERTKYYNNALKAFGVTPAS